MTYYWQFAQLRFTCTKRGSSWFCIRLSRKVISQGVVLLMLGEYCSLWLSRDVCWWGKTGRYVTDTQCTVQGREEAIGQRKIIMLKLFLTCLRIGILSHQYDFKYIFYFGTILDLPKSCKDNIENFYILSPNFPLYNRDTLPKTKKSTLVLY